MKLTRLLPCIGLLLTAPVYSTTVLEGTGQASNQNIPTGFGSNIAAAEPGISVSAGTDGVTGTPNIALTFDPNGQFGWQTWADWDGRGETIQHDGGGAQDIIFTPSPNVQVVIDSVDLDEWAGGGGITADWSVNGPTSGLVASGTWTGDTAGLRETIAINATGAVGEALTLTIEQTGGSPDFFAIDNLTFDQIGLDPAITSFSTDRTLADGSPATLSWEILNPSTITSITLDDGSGPVDVSGDTNLTTGLGSTSVSPAVTTTYTLEVNGSLTSELTMVGGTVDSFTSDTVLAVSPDFEVVLSWQVTPPDATVTLDDGSSPLDVTGDTDPISGIGSRVVTPSSASTVYTLDANGGPAASIRILRAQDEGPGLSLSSSSVDADTGTLTVSWSGAAAGPSDWIGIYRVGDTPGVEFSTAFLYLNGTQATGAGPAAGSVEFTGLAEGEYFAALFLNDGYEIAQGPVLFSSATPPPSDPFLTVTDLVRSGSEFTLTWESTTGREYDIYASDSPGGDPLDDPDSDWNRVAEFLPSAGDDTTSFTEDLGASPPAQRFYVIYEYIAP